MEAEDDISHCPPLTLKILQKVKFLSETLPEANHYFKADNKYLVQRDWKSEKILFGNTMIISTEGALRRLLAYDDHRIPSHPLHSTE